MQDLTDHNDDLKQKLSAVTAELAHERATVAVPRRVAVELSSNSIRHGRNTVPTQTSCASNRDPRRDSSDPAELPNSAASTRDRHRIPIG